MCVIVVVVAAVLHARMHRAARFRAARYAAPTRVPPFRRRSTLRYSSSWPYPQRAAAVPRCWFDAVFTNKAKEAAGKPRRSEAPSFPPPASLSITTLATARMLLLLLSPPCVSRPPDSLARSMILFVQICAALRFARCFVASARHKNRLLTRTSEEVEPEEDC